MLLHFKRSEVVGSEAECDITMIREVIVRVRPVSNNNTPSKKRAMESIEKDPLSFQPSGLCMLSTESEWRRCDSTLRTGMRPEG